MVLELRYIISRVSRKLLFTSWFWEMAGPASSASILYVTTGLGLGPDDGASVHYPSPSMRKKETTERTNRELSRTPRVRLSRNSARVMGAVGVIPGESHPSAAREGDILKGPEFALALFYFPNAPKSTDLPIWK
jgi:hypothetical protein